MMLKKSAEQVKIDNDAFDWLCIISDAHRARNKTKLIKSIENSSKWLESILNPTGEYVPTNKYKSKKIKK